MAVDAAQTMPKARAKSSSLDSSPPQPVIAMLLAVAILVVLFTLYTLWKFWPTESILSSKSSSPINYLGLHREVSVEIRLFVVVAVSGALGGLLHATRSFAWYVGHSSLRLRWLPYYIAMLFIGAGLATIVYIVLRGGIVSGKASQADVNPYGFAAVAAIVGLFSEQALEMLKRVATDFFAEAPQGTDQVDQATQVDESTGPTVELLDAVPVDATTATLKAIVTPNGKATSFHFDYGTDATYTAGGAYDASTDETTLPTLAQQSAIATAANLVPGTTYHYRLVANDGTGDPIASDDQTFVMPAGEEAAVG